MHAMRTTTTPWISWFCFGHSTFLSSAIDSATNRLPREPGICRSAGATRADGAVRTAGCCCWAARAGRATCAPSCAEASARRARRCARVWRAMLLARLPVGRVTSAPAAVLLQLNAVGRVSLRLLGLIVAPLAFGAGERDPDPYPCLRSHISVFLSMPWQAYAPPAGASIVAEDPPSPLAPPSGLCGSVAAGGAAPPAPSPLM